MPATINLYEELYDKLLNDLGIDADWGQAVVCNCVNPLTGQPNFVCPVCGGSGYRYLKSKRIRVGVTSFDSRFTLDSLMLREPGTAYATPKADVIMGYRDRLRFPDFKCKFSEVIHFNFDEDGLGVSPKTYRDILDVVFLADDKYEYEKNVDFVITEDKFHIKFIDANNAKKFDNTSMSLLYYTTPSYLVDDLLHEIRSTMSDRNTSKETFRELPKQYKLVREDFVYKVKKPEPLEGSEMEEGITV